MLKDKALKKKQKEIVKIEAGWSKAQHDVIRSKISVSGCDADILAREQTKNRALKLCMENVSSTTCQFHLKKMSTKRSTRFKGCQNKISSQL